jgi:predicted transcriptional regulator
MSSPPEFRDLMLMENPGFDDVMRCVFGIQEREVDTYICLLGCDEEVSAEIIADEMDRDRSNVTRNLARLREKGVVSRHRRLLEGGGHVYCYTAEPLDEVQARMHHDLDAWTESVHGRIEEFGEVPTDGRNLGTGNGDHAGPSDSRDEER